MEQVKAALFALLVAGCVSTEKASLAAPPFYVLTPAKELLQPLKVALADWEQATGLTATIAPRGIDVRVVEGYIDCRTDDQMRKDPENKHLSYGCSTKSTPAIGPSFISKVEVSSLVMAHGPHAVVNVLKHELGHIFVHMNLPEQYNFKGVMNNRIDIVKNQHITINDIQLICSKARCKDEVYHSSFARSDAR